MGTMVERQDSVLKVVCVSEMKVSDDPGVVLVTYALGSCIGLTLYDPVCRVGGMIHCMLPLSRIDPERSRQEPCKFADTGVCVLLQALMDRGATRRNLVAKVAGGAMQFERQTSFNVGERNLAVVRRVLWRNDILISGEHVGGTRPRSLFLHMATGRTVVKMGKTEIEL